MALRAAENTQKILASTTSYLIGAYEREEILLAMAWPGMRDQAFDGSKQRSAFVIAFETQPIEKLPGTVIPQHSFVGETICAYLSVLFGKRFDNHGGFEINGSFHVPDLRSFTASYLQELPQNSNKPRVDFPVSPNLAEFSRIRRLVLTPPMEERFLQIFHSASKFYLLALQNAELDAEVAYLNLITAGEILSGFYEYDRRALLSEEDKEKLRRVEALEPDGPELAAFVLSRIFQVKRSFVATILRLIDETFFERSECRDGFFAFKKDTFEKSISAAYDLRSRYVHTGTSFGSIVFRGAGGLNPEMQLGMPIVGDREIEKLLARAPTYVGLERVIRFCLINFAIKNGAYQTLEPEIASTLAPLAPTTEQG
jgi:hypothetical protein